MASEEVMSFKAERHRVAITALIGVLLFILCFEYEDDVWMASLWLIDYPGEFLKRALVGEVFRFIVPEGVLKLDSITATSFIVSVLLVVVFSIYTALTYCRNYFLTAALLLSSFTVQQFAYETGRFDQLNLLITYSCLLLLMKVHSNWILLLLFPVSALMLCIHEAAALLNIPVIFTCLSLLASQQKLSWKLPLIYLFFVLVVFFLIVTFGGLDKTDYASWVVYMKEKPSDFVLHEGSISIMKNSLMDNLMMSYERLVSSKTLSRMFRAVLVLLPVLFFIQKTFGVLKKDQPLVAALIVVPVLAVFPMFFLGIDFYRWIAVLLLNYITVLGFWMYLSGNHTVIGNISSRLIGLWCFVSVYAGPLGISVALPEKLLFLGKF